MFVTSTRRPNRPVEPAVVTFGEVRPDITDFELIQTAYEATGEHPRACFGTKVRRYGTDASVVIYRD